MASVCSVMVAPNRHGMNQIPLLFCRRCVAGWHASQSAALGRFDKFQDAPTIRVFFGADHAYRRDDVVEIGDRPARPLGIAAKITATCFYFDDDRERSLERLQCLLPSRVDRLVQTPVAPTISRPS